MARVSEVLRHAFEHHYNPVPGWAHEGASRYLCNAVELSRGFTMGERQRACAAIHEAMQRHAREYSGPGVLEFMQALGASASLRGLLTQCHQPADPSDLIAWHLALIEKLESEGN